MLMANSTTLVALFLLSLQKTGAVLGAYPRQQPVFILVGRYLLFLDIRYKK